MHLTDSYGILLLEAVRLKQLSFFSTSSALNSLQEFCSDLSERGIVDNSHPQDVDKNGFQSLATLPNVLYAGFDATSDSLHVGNLSILNSLLRAAFYGCKSIALVGQTTAVAGDPSGRTSGLTPMVNKMDEHFIKRIVSNFCSHYGEKYKDKLSHTFRVGDMHRLAAVKARMRPGFGIDYSEFSYQNLQAMDWLHLAQYYNCYFQLGGSDQLGNFDAGFDYIRRITGKVSCGLGLSLVTDHKGEKLGKSVTSPNASVWLDPEKTSPFAFFQFCFVILVNFDELLKHFSLEPLNRILAILEKHEANLGGWIAQEHLAVEMTRLVHGEEGLNLAQRCSKRSMVTFFSSATSTHHISKKDVLTIGRLADLVKRGRSSGLNAVKSGGLKLNGVRYTDVDEKVDYEKLKFGGKDLTIVCWGKRHFDLVVWSE
ncbi:unnamed protein product [Enterobius vermicularis]|uniref:Tyrosine--tRNA ligase n=1 Tax=Enterobius vermicularis TaxID=51028 RepID=A0A0N4VCL2_ENTVE|nr:unnamed protein product [Enterobius vermicularis]